MVKDREFVGFPMNGRKMENLRYPENGKMMGQRGRKERGHGDDSQKWTRKPRTERRR